jgi:SWI/SNF-related matrix-associated actin-dependent regulator of chromatin subfamily A3
MCIGAIVSRAIMIYPAPCALIGSVPPAGVREKYELREWRGAEFMKVKLKVSGLDCFYAESKILIR